MHRMTRRAGPNEIRAPFAGESLELGADRVVMTTRDGERFVERQSNTSGDELYRVTRVIGGRHREDYAGVRVRAEAPLGPALGEERILPVSFLLLDGSLRYKGYSVMVPARSGLEAGDVWRKNCIFCHNTVPGLALYYDDLLADERASYQGSPSGRLPPERAFRYTVDDEPAIEHALALELSRFGRTARTTASLAEVLKETLAATRDDFAESDLVELGIGCEACHGGAREHAEHPLAVRPSFALTGGLRVQTANGHALTAAQEENRTCARCHTVLFSRYPFSWEGQTRTTAVGGSSINSGEARDLLLSRCSLELRCSSCHDPHAEDDRDSLASLAGPTGTELCTSCHRDLRGPERVRAHTHHAPESAGSACINCHMPKKNLGLAYELTRYHRIGSPTDRERVEGDRPLECALCHVDRSVEQIVLTMERFWQRRYDRKKLRRLYGADLSINALRATLLGGKAHEKLAALGSLPLTEASAPALRRALDNEYPLVGLFARARLGRIESRAAGRGDGPDAWVDGVPP
jgi:predicted CXXCH cytochrome family protein